MPTFAPPGETRMRQDLARLTETLTQVVSRQEQVSISMEKASENLKMAMESATRMAQINLETERNRLWQLEVNRVSPVEPSNLESNKIKITSFVKSKDNLSNTTSELKTAANSLARSFLKLNLLIPLINFE